MPEEKTFETSQLLALIGEILERVSHIECPELYDEMNSPSEEACRYILERL
jgi:hypothetical protein